MAGLQQLSTKNGRDIGGWRFMAAGMYLNQVLLQSIAMRHALQLWTISNLEYL